MSDGFSFRFLALLSLSFGLLSFSVREVSASAQGPLAGLTAEESAWVDATLDSLTLEDKVGQMIAARSSGGFAHADDPELKELLAAARSGRIGGVVLFAGPPESTARRIDRLQAAARLPLLVASDYEWGAGMRVDGASRFPRAMAFGAGGEPEDAAFLGRVTAQEARALGVQLVLAPVLDLATVAENPVINNRSFGSDPDRSADLAVPFLEALQQGGVLATAKHFPGHGATATDSHHGLAYLAADRPMLDRLELAPFRRAIDAGVAAIMPGHIAAPALDGRSDRPASQSPEILQGLLRRKLGFDGLIVSDALDMAGARQGSWGGAVAVATVQAGTDLLLVPPSTEVARLALLRAIGRGELTEERIDDSVRRLLSAKARAGLHRKRRVDLISLDRRVGDPELGAKIERIAERAVTLIENRPIDDRPERAGNQDVESGLLLPLSSRRPPRVLLVDFVPERAGDVDARILGDELRRRARTVQSVRYSQRGGPTIGFELARATVGVDVVVVAHYGRLSHWAESERVASSHEIQAAENSQDEPPPTLERGLVGQLRERIASGVPVILVSLADPWTLTALPEAGAHLAVYDASPASQRAVARALFGEISIGGRLPVTLAEGWQVGHGMSLSGPFGNLTPAEPERVGMSGKGLDRVVSVLRSAVENGVTPGAVALVSRRGRVVLHHAVGRQTYSPDSLPVTVDTRYDLASLTKVVATTTVAMKLVESGQLDLLRPIADYLPELRDTEKPAIRALDLLAHASGFLWWTDLYLRHGHLPPRAARQAYLREIFDLPLVDPPRARTVYSDLGILVLGEILERVGGASFEKLVQNLVLDPLAMSSTGFCPADELHDRVAPTEQDPWRGRILRGEVHDENAFGLGGVAPHAGLFSTAADLAVLTQTLLDGGRAARWTRPGPARAPHGPSRDRRFLNGATIERFVGRAEVVADSSRAIGWDTPSSPSSAGRYFSASSFGHTGFTGTSIWVDPEQEVVAILLTNRVHPTRENRAIRALRPAFHDAVMESIVDRSVEPRPSD